MEKAAQQDQRTLAAMVDELLADVKRLLMLPFSSVLEAFPGLIRDLSRQQGKEIDFEIEGGETEIDASVAGVTVRSSWLSLIVSADTGAPYPHTASSIAQSCA